MSFTTTVVCNAQNPYVLVHYDLGAPLAIEFADVVGLRRTAAGVVFTDFFIQYSADDAVWVNFGAAFAPKTNTVGNTRRRTGPVTARYWRVAKIGANNYGGALFTMEAFNLWQTEAGLSDSRIVDFEFSVEQKYAMLFTDRNARVYVDGVYKADVRTNYASADLPLLNWTQSLDTLILVQPDVAPMRFEREGADTEWHSESLAFDFIPKYAFNLVVTKPVATLTPSTTEGLITLTASAPVFLAAHENQFIWGNLGGARIVDFVDTTHVKAQVVLPFFNANAIASQAWTLETGYESVWSATRGWPAAAVFMQNRLVMGGSSSLPNGIGLSRIGEYFNFDPGQALDDDAIFAIIQSNDVPAILNLRADRQLQIFTSAAEYFVPSDVNGGAITPRNISFKRSTAYGSKAGVRPQNVSGSTVFLQRNGKVFRDFVFSDREDAFVAPSLSLLSSHIILNPVDTAIRKATSTDDADLLLAVNDDGSATICLTMRDQSIAAWCPQQTAGLFKRCGAVDTDAYFVVERTIDGDPHRYFERFDSGLYVDSGVVYAGALSTLVGLSHLEGLTVKVRADDSILDDEVVAGGDITPSRAVVAEAQVGLDFTPIAETLDAIRETRIGVRIDGKTRISRVMVDLVDTQNLIVNGQRINFRRFGDPFNTPPPRYTGRKVVDGLLGWNDGSRVTITQDEPAPMTVRLIEYQLRG